MSSKDKYKVIYFGTPDFAVPALRQLESMSSFNVVAVVTQPDKEAGRGRKVRESAIKKVAKEFNIPVFQPLNLRKNSRDFLDNIAQFGQIDIGVVTAFGQILPTEILSYPKRGLVNIHASLLPRWRGAAPIQRSILAGDSKTGVCLMEMEEGLDTGAVISQAETEISKSDNAESIHDRLSILGADLVERDLEKYVLQEIEPVAQLEDGVTYAKKITNDDLVIDWSKTALEIENKIRAFSPYPGSFTYWDGIRLKVLKASARAMIIKVGSQCGSVTEVDKRLLEIQCKDSILSVERLQREGKKAMDIDEFLRGTNIKKNDILSSHE